MKLVNPAYAIRDEAEEEYLLLIHFTFPIYIQETASKKTGERELTNEGLFAYFC